MRRLTMVRVLLNEAGSLEAQAAIQSGSSAGHIKDVMAESLKGMAGRLTDVENRGLPVLSERTHLTLSTVRLDYALDILNDMDVNKFPDDLKKLLLKGVEVLEQAKTIMDNTR